SDEEADRLKQAWRDAHPHVVKLWADLDRAARRAVANPDKTIVVNKHLAFRFDGTFLRMRLPSGRKVAYPFARLEENPRGETVVIFKDNAAGKFVDCRHGHGAWPGLWIENAVQAVARDLLVAAMHRLEAAGYPIVMTVHDEIVAEVSDGVGSKEDFLRTMTELPDWAAGLPVAATVRNRPRYAEVEEAPTTQENPPPWVDDAAPISPDAAEGGAEIKQPRSQWLVRIWFGRARMGR